MRARFALSVSSFVLAFGLAFSSAGAQATATSICKDGTTSTVSGKGACSSHGGVDTKATAAAKQVTCADGSASKSGRGACSGHGGVKTAVATAAKSEPVATKAAPPAKSGTAAKIPTKGGNDDPTDATAQCKDGTYSHAKTRQGACSRHGGVGKFLK